MSLDARSIYIDALKNTHVLELQALQLMERQVECLKNYPELEAALRRHIQETHGQRDRLEEVLSSLGDGPSAIKEGFLGFVGNMMALGHVPAQDEILKNTFANHAFENSEITVYTSLLTIGEAAGQSAHRSAFELSLREEQGMAKAVADLIQPTTRRYLELSAAGAGASH